jgi:hypothetical protein
MNFDIDASTYDKIVTAISEEKGRFFIKQVDCVW